MQRICTILLLVTTIVFTEAIVKLEISNREPGPIWVGIRGNTGHPHLEDGGISLEQGQTVYTISGCNIPNTSRKLVCS